MKKISRHALAASAAARWKKQYRNRSEHKWDIVCKALVKLGESPEPSAVDAVIGNGSWTVIPHCTECGKDPTDFVVEVGEKDDYDSNTVWLCNNCIQKLITLVEDQT